jgi:arginine deiminase
MTTYGVHSEVGRLRKVMVHRPGLSLQRLTPTNHDNLLLDDVLWVERAQYKHDHFVARILSSGQPRSTRSACPSSTKSGRCSGT